MAGVKTVHTPFMIAISVLMASLNLSFVGDPIR